MATFTERLELLITSTGKDAVRDINAVGSATTQLTNKQKLLGAGQSFVNDQLSQFGISAGSAGAAMKVAAGAAGALAAIKVGEFAKDAADEWANLAGEVRNFQRASGASAEDSSRWVAALDDLGISSEKGANAAFKLNREIAAGGDNLAKFGVEVATTADGSADLTGTLLNVADAYAASNDPAERAALAFAAFGKAGKDLIPVLEQGSKGLKQFFEGADVGRQIFTQAQLDQARAYELALDNLGDTLRGLKLAVGGAVAPTITTFANTLAQTITTVDDATSAFGGLGGVLETGWNFTPLANAMHGVGAASNLLQGNFAQAGEEFVKSLPVVGGLASAFGLGADEAENFATQQNDLKAATQKVLDLQVQGKRGTKEYADAVADARTQSDALKTSTDAVGQSFKTAADKEFEATQQHLLLAQSGLALQAATLNVKAALDDEAKATQDATDAAAEGVDKSAAVQGAHIKTQQAILGVIAAAQQRAIQALGPSATAEEQHQAAVNATTFAVNGLANSVPGTVKALQDLGYNVVTLPDGSITITENIDDVISKVKTLAELVAGVGHINVFGGNSTSTNAAPAAAGAQLALVPAAMAAPRAAAPVTHLHVNVTSAGLGADAPQIQRAVVNALRAYTRRNGPLDVPVRAS